MTLFSKLSLKFLIILEIQKQILKPKTGEPLKQFIKPRDTLLRGIIISQDFNIVLLIKFSLKSDAEFTFPI